MAGARLLRCGGNAVDAIVAAKFAATITELPLTSLAGGGACLWGDADQGYKVLDLFAATPGRGLKACRHWTSRRLPSISGKRRRSFTSGKRPRRFR